MTTLSPTTRIILNAFIGDQVENDDIKEDRKYFASAIRAAAQSLGYCSSARDKDVSTRYQDSLFAIAIKLEQSNG
jgi:hypothetical protein